MMLQVGLLLLGCVLSRYLWEINTIVTSDVLSVTWFGAIFYLFILIARMASETCAYQIPDATLFRHIIRNIRHRLLATLYSACAVVPSVVSTNISRLFQASWCFSLLFHWWASLRQPWYTIHNFYSTVFVIVVALFVAPARDAYCLARAILQSLVAFRRTMYHQLIGKPRTPRPWSTGIPFRTPDLTTKRSCRTYGASRGYSTWTEPFTCQPLNTSLLCRNLFAFTPPSLLILSKYSLGASVSAAARW